MYRQEIPGLETVHHFLKNVLGGMAGGVERVVHLPCVQGKVGQSLRVDSEVQDLEPLEKHL